MASHLTLIRTSDERNTLQPKPERFPMNGRDNLEAEKRKTDERSQQRTVGQRATPPGECSREDRATRIDLRDPDLHLLSGWGNAETIGRFHFHERRDVELFCLALADD